MYLKFQLGKFSITRWLNLRSNSKLASQCMDRHWVELKTKFTKHFYNCNHKSMLRRVRNRLLVHRRVKYDTKQVKYKTFESNAFRQEIDGNISRESKGFLAEQHRDGWTESVPRRFIIYIIALWSSICRGSNYRAQNKHVRI